MDNTIQALLQPNTRAVRLLRTAAIVGCILTILLSLLQLFVLPTTHLPTQLIVFISIAITLIAQISNIPYTTVSWKFWISLFLAVVTLVSIFVMLYASPAFFSLSTINTLLLGGALLFFQFPLIRYFTRIGQSLTLVASLSTMFGVISYIYQLNPSTISYFNMPISDAFIFSLLGLSFLCATVDHGIVKVVTKNTPSSKLALRLIVVTLTLPAFIGYVLGYMQTSHMLTPQFATALFVLSTTVIFSIIIWMNTRMLQKKELENLLIKKALEDENIKLKINAEELANKALALEEKKEETYDYLMKGDLVQTAKPVGD